VTVVRNFQDEIKKYNTKKRNIKNLFSKNFIFVTVITDVLPDAAHLIMIFLSHTCCKMINNIIKLYYQIKHGGKTVVFS